jgi:transcriptional regulator with XRE-family HTH domain
MEFENLSKSLRWLRELTGLSQYRFARLSGISRGRISLVECGHSELNEDEHCRAEPVLRAAIADRYGNFKSIVERGPESSNRAADGEW